MTAKAKIEKPLIVLVSDGDSRLILPKGTEVIKVYTTNTGILRKIKLPKGEIINVWEKYTTYQSRAKKKKLICLLCQKAIIKGTKEHNFACMCEIGTVCSLCYTLHVKIFEKW